MQCDLQQNNHLCEKISLSDKSVRYGRVPKRTRDVGGSSLVDDLTSGIGIVVNGSNQANVNNANILVANIRVNTPTAPSTYLSSTTTTSSTSQLCSTTSTPPTEQITYITTDFADTSKNNNENVNNNNNLNINQEMSVYDLILCISQAHRTHCTYTESLLKGLNHRPLQTPSASSVSNMNSNDQIQVKEEHGLAASPSEVTEQQRVWLWQQYAIRMTPAVQSVVEFAKRVPGFCDFTQDDQLILIKLGFFEVWLNNIAKATTDNTITFDDGTYLTRQQLEIMYDSNFVSGLWNFTSGINACNLSDTEVGLYSALILLAADRPGITEHKLILKTRERIAEALRVQIVRSRPNAANALQIMPALEAKIQELHSMGLRHFNHLDWFRTNWKHTLRLPPLFAEIFDIPKCEEDL